MVCRNVFRIRTLVDTLAFAACVRRGKSFVVPKCALGFPYTAHGRALCFSVSALLRRLNRHHLSFGQTEDHFVALRLQPPELDRVPPL